MSDQGLVAGQLTRSAKKSRHRAGRLLDEKAEVAIGVLSETWILLDVLLI